MNTNSSPMTAEARRAMWEEVQGDEAKGNTQLALTNGGADKPNNEQTNTEGNPAAHQAADQAANEHEAGAQVDPLAGLPQEVRDVFVGMQSTIAQLQTRMRGAEGHIGGLKSSLKAAREAASSAREDGHDAPTDTEIRAAQAGGSKAMAALAEKYPEFADDLKAVLTEELAAVRTVEKPKADEREAGGYTAEDIERAKRDAYIEARHEGWQNLIATPEFVGWYQRQSQEVQALGLDPSPQAGAKLIDTFKAERARRAAPDERLSRFEGLAKTNVARRGSMSTEKGIEEMSREELWKHLAEQNK